MKARDKNVLYFVCSALFLVIIYKFYYNHKQAIALKDSVILTAIVESVEYTRGTTYVNVQYQFKGKILHACYDTYNRESVDSLKQYKKIRLRVSRQYPDEYIEYIGIENFPGASMK
jgi:hypothetical protein